MLFRTLAGNVKVLAKLRNFGFIFLRLLWWDGVRSGKVQKREINGQTVIWDGDPTHSLFKSWTLIVFKKMDWPLTNYDFSKSGATRLSMSKRQLIARASKKPEIRLDFINLHTFPFLSIFSYETTAIIFWNLRFEVEFQVEVGFQNQISQALSSNRLQTHLCSSSRCIVSLRHSVPTRD